MRDSSCVVGRAGGWVRRGRPGRGWQRPPTASHRSPRRRRRRSGRSRSPPSHPARSRARTRPRSARGSRRPCGRSSRGRGRGDAARRSRSPRRSRRRPAAGPAGSRRATASTSGFRTSSTRHRVAELVLLQLRLRDAGGGPVVGDRGGHDHDVGVGRPRAVAASSIDCAVVTATTRTPIGHRDLEVRGEQHDVRAAVARRLRERDALAAGGRVAEEPHGVERLARAAGGDEDLPAREPVVRRRAPRCGRGPGSRRRPRRARPRRCPRAPTCGRRRSRCRSAARSRARRRSTPRASSVRTFACVAACAHISVCIAGATTTGAAEASTVVPSRSSARPDGELRERVRGRRGDDDQVGRLAEGDVPHLGDALVEVGLDRVAADRLERRPARRTAGPPASARRARRALRARARGRHRRPCRPRCRR